MHAQNKETNLPFQLWFTHEPLDGEPEAAADRKETYVVGSSSYH